MPEIRFTITDKLNERILEVAEELGVDKSEYIKSLILQDLRDKGVRRNE
jgi:prolyl-tRNA editing enzyme YbaK/EbsC (Cys-tRNA(Pro) deacylase)